MGGPSGSSRARTAYTPTAGSSSLVVRMFAVGQPSLRPRPAPFTTSPSRSKGRPSNMLAASTRPSSTNSRTLVLEHTRPFTVTGGTTRSRTPRASSDARNVSTVPARDFP